MNSRRTEEKIGAEKQKALHQNQAFWRVQSLGLSFTVENKINISLLILRKINFNRRLIQGHDMSVPSYK